MKKGVDRWRLMSYTKQVGGTEQCLRQKEYGGIAQLGERLNGIQEVSGSIPLISTKFKMRECKLSHFFILGSRASRSEDHIA